MLHVHNFYSVLFIPCSNLFQFWDLFLLLLILAFLMFIHCDLMIFGIYYLLIVIYEHHTTHICVYCVCVSVCWWARPKLLTVSNHSHGLYVLIYLSFFLLLMTFFKALNRAHNFISNSFLINFFHRRCSFLFIYLCLMAFEFLFTFHFNSMCICFSLQLFPI